MEKWKTVSSSPPRGKSYGKQSLWDLVLCPSWLKTTLGRGDNLRDCMQKWASAGGSVFIQIVEQSGKKAAHCLLWLIKKSLYQRTFESAFNGFSSWFWFLTGCGHLTKKRRPWWVGKGIFNPEAQVRCFSVRFCERQTKWPYTHARSFCLPSGGCCLWTSPFVYYPGTLGTRSF